MSRDRPIIFDFDGVIADSELPANLALAETLSALGLPTTLEESLRDYCGHNWRETQRRIEVRLGGPLPDDFRDRHRERAQHHLARGLTAVPGAAAFLARTTGRPRAVASSSGIAWLTASLAALGLADHFGDHLYSAEGMEQGKPHPAIYLAAARGLRVPPEDCVAIEDSPVGARAAVAAGMTVYGLLAAGHIADRTRHAAALREAGVHRVIDRFDAIEA